MINMHKIDNEKLTFPKVQELFLNNSKLELSSDSRKRIQKCRDYLDKKMSSEKEIIYGINTGFGSLCNHIISKNDLKILQKNLVVSHACGMGEEVPREIVKLMLFLKIQSLSYGNSGVQVATVQRLIDFYNNNIIPVVYRQGSLGASGDLAPLAHLSLPLLGLGEVYFENKKQDAKNVLKRFNWKPVELHSKEGLALLNGTQFMSAYGVYCLLKSYKLSEIADIIAALSIDAYDGRIEPFHELIQKIRQHKGQLQTSQNINRILKGSQITKRKKEHIQDPYSFRCIPQVHGAAKDAVGYVAYVFLNEINAVTDNPTIFPDEDLIISAGNFHGQPLALALDFLSIAVAELGSISERRTYQLISGKRGLPSFLVAKPGLNSGFMIPQYTAASIVSQNKQLCTPSSIDSMESSQEQEDHVSMGANAATKAYEVIMNLEKILAIELFNAMQAIEFRRPAKTSPYLEKIIKEFRKKVDFIETDVVMYDKMQASIYFIRELEKNIEIKI
ncbi:MAG: histidine ammonia-lyase [Bacteroidales bacterium]|nr:histidine ammonia-lyase [Bacteroidales bacterium]